MAHLHKIGPTQNFWFRQASTTHLALQVKLLQFFGPRLNSWTQGCSCSIWGWTVDYWTLLYKHCRTIFSHSSTLTTFKLGRVGFFTGANDAATTPCSPQGWSVRFPPMAMRLGVQIGLKHTSAKLPLDPLGTQIWSTKESQAEASTTQAGRS